MSKLILFTGDKGSGKTTSGKYVASKLGLPTYSFAAPLKHIINTLFDWDERHAEGDLKEVEMAYRLQSRWRDDLRFLVSTTFGKRSEAFVDIISSPVVTLFEQEIMSRFRYKFHPYMIYTSPRKVYQFFGTDVCRTISDTIWLDLAADVLAESERGLVIMDCRFPNEGDWGIQNGGTIVKIEGGLSKPNTDAHISEKGLPDHQIHEVIHNDMTENLFYKLEEFMYREGGS